MSQTGSFNYPSYGYRRWKAPVATSSALPTTGSVAGDARITLDTLLIWIFNGTSWAVGAGNMTGPGSSTTNQIAEFADSTGTVLKALSFGTANQVLGMTNAATGHEYKTLSVGTTGTDFAIANAANSVAFNLPDASATARGVITTGVQTIAGVKTFSSTITGSISGNAATVTTNANLTGVVTSVGNATSFAASPTFTGTTSTPALSVTNATNQITLGTTNTVTIDSVAPAASRVYTLTDAGAAASFVISTGTTTVISTASTQLNYLNAATGTTGTTSTNLVFSASPTFTGTPILPTPFTIGAVSMTATGTQLNYLNAATGTTGTASTNLVYSASPTFTGTITAAIANFSGLLSANLNAAVSGAAAVNGSGGGIVATNLSIFDTTSQTTGTGGGITFIGYQTAQSATAICGSIKAAKVNSTAGNAAWNMNFYTKADGANEALALTIGSDKSGTFTNRVIATSISSDTGASFNLADLPVLASRSGTQLAGYGITGRVSHDIGIYARSSSDTLCLGFDGGGGFVDALTLTPSTNAATFAGALSTTNGKGTFTNTSTTDYAGVIASSSASFTGEVAYIYSNNTTGTAFYLFRGDNGASTQFRVRGDGNVTNTNNSYGAISDIKLKENITDARPYLDDLCKLKVRKYKLKSTGESHLGLVAQEVETIFPGLVDSTEDDQIVDSEDDNGIKNRTNIKLGTQTKNIKYSIINVMMIKAIQEQQQQIEDLKTEIKNLKVK